MRKKVLLIIIMLQLFILAIAIPESMAKDGCPKLGFEITKEKVTFCIIADNGSVIKKVYPQTDYEFSVVMIAGGEYRVIVHKPGGNLGDAGNEMYSMKEDQFVKFIEDMSRVKY